MSWSLSLDAPLIEFDAIVHKHETMSIVAFERDIAKNFLWVMM